MENESRYRPIPNVVGHDLECTKGIRTLERALWPYRDFEETREQLRDIKLNPHYEIARERNEK